MSKNNDTAPSQAIDLTVDHTSGLTRRIVTFVQSRGGLGKSFFAEIALCWADFAEVPHAAIDADAENKTLSTRYRDRVIFLPATQNDNQFARMLDALPEAPLVVIDIPAQATTFLLEAIQKFQLPEMWKRQGTRVTIVLFAVNDPMAIKTADAAHRTLGGAVDYLLVENPIGKQEWERFYSSPIGKRLLEAKTPTVRMPTLTTATLSAWGAAQAKAKRHMGLSEVVNASGLSVYNQHELQHFLNTMFYQFEENAATLLPDPSLIKNRTVAPKATRSVAEATEFFDVV